MLVTVTIDDDVLAAARVLADQNGSSLGSALSALARRGFKSTSTAGIDRALAMFAVPDDAEPITSEDVYQALGEWP